MSELKDKIFGKGESGFTPLAEAIEKNKAAYNAPLEPPEMPVLRQRATRRKSVSRQRARGGRASTILTDKDTLG